MPPKRAAKRTIASLKEAISKKEQLIQQQLTDIIEEKVTDKTPASPAAESIIESLAEPELIQQHEHLEELAENSLDLISSCLKNIDNIDEQRTAVNSASKEHLEKLNELEALKVDVDRLIVLCKISEECKNDLLRGAFEDVEFQRTIQSLSTQFDDVQRLREHISEECLASIVLSFEVVFGDLMKRIFWHMHSIIKKIDIEDSLGSIEKFHSSLLPYKYLIDFMVKYPSVTGDTLEKVFKLYLKYIQVFYRKKFDLVLFQSGERPFEGEKFTPESFSASQIKARLYLSNPDLSLGGLTSSSPTTTSVPKDVLYCEKVFTKVLNHIHSLIEVEETFVRSYFSHISKEMFALELYQNAFNFGALQKKLVSVFIQNYSDPFGILMCINQVYALNSGLFKSFLVNSIIIPFWQQYQQVIREILFKASGHASYSLLPIQISPCAIRMSEFCALNILCCRNPLVFKCVSNCVRRQICNLSTNAKFNSPTDNLIFMINNLDYSKRYILSVTGESLLEELIQEKISLFVEQAKKVHQIYDTRHLVNCFTNSEMALLIEEKLKT